MGEEDAKEKKKRSTRCIVCGSVVGCVAVVAALLLILYFSAYRPKDPRVQVSRMQLLSLAAAPNASSLAIAVNVQLSIYNPNRADFHMDRQPTSAARLFFQGSQVGFTPLPTPLLFPRSSTTVSLRVAMDRPIQLNAALPLPSSSCPCLPLTLAVVLLGHVTTAGLFSHHSHFATTCHVQVSFAYPQGYIDSYTCFKTHSLAF